MTKDFKWTPQDNVIAQAEMQLSTLLSRELTARPEVSLQVMYMSRSVQEQVIPIIRDLEKAVGHSLKATTEAYRNTDGSRTVTVEIR